MKNLKYRFCT